MGAQDEIVDVKIADTFRDLEKESARIYPFRAAYELLNENKPTKERIGIPVKKQVKDMILFFIQNENQASKHAVRNAFVVETSNMMPYPLTFALKREYTSLIPGKIEKKNKLFSLGKESFFRSDISKGCYEQRFASMLERELGSSDFPIYVNIFEYPEKKYLTCVLECDLHSMIRTPDFTLSELAKDFSGLRSEITKIYLNPIDFGFKKLESYDNAFKNNEVQK